MANIYTQKVAQPRARHKLYTYTPAKHEKWFSPQPAIIQKGVVNIRTTASKWRQFTDYL